MGTGSWSGREWFEERFGRPPAGEAEITGGWLHVATMEDPSRRTQAERVRAYAETMGGDTLAFARAQWGYYWGPAEFLPVADVAAAAGVTEDRAAEIMADIWRATRVGPGPTAA